jgi:hypothetical protein
MRVWEEKELGGVKDTFDGKKRGGCDDVYTRKEGTRKSKKEFHIVPSKMTTTLKLTRRMVVARR